MTPLRARDLLTVWEQGRERQPLERALLVLATGVPEYAATELAALSVGRRNGLLLDLRDQTIGRAFECVAQCPACGQLLELSIESSELRYDAPGPAGLEAGTTLTVGEYTLEYRLLTSRDLAAVSAALDVESARTRLIERCVVAAWHAGVPVPAGELPADVVAGLADAIEDRDPLADLVMPIRCHECGHGWVPRLDVESFFWIEIGAQAQRVLNEVHTLARAYGWSEADILAMHSVRRRAYLEMAPVD